MKSKLKSFFTTNLGWKIASLVLGIVIWIMLSNTQDPTVTRTIYVPITYTNEDLLKTNEQLVVLSTPETVGITVSVRQSKQNRANSSLFSCTADLVDHSGGDLSSQRVHVNVTQVSGTDVILDWSYLRGDPNVTVSMDNYITKTFTVGLQAEDSLSEGLILDSTVSFEPSTVTVSGPETAFGSLAAVKAVVNMQELSQDGGGVFSREVELVMYDANNQEIGNEDGELELSAEKTVMSATVLRTATVSIVTDGVTGSPADGYKYYTSTVEPSEITVYGLKSTVADLSTIRIPASAVDITGITQDTTFNVDITPYLPDGVTMADSDGNVFVTVYVEELQTKTVSVPASQVQLTGTSSENTYTITSISLNLKVNGFQDDLDLLNTDNIVLTADVSGLTEGTHMVSVSVDALSGYTFENADNLYITVRVKEPEEVTEQTEEETETSKSDETETEKSSSEESTSGTEAGSDEESTSKETSASETTETTAAETTEKEAAGESIR